MNIQRASLGRRARCGDFYNAYTDTFCTGLSASAFPQKVPEYLIKDEPNRFVKCDIQHADSRSERCKALGLQNELKLSVMGLDVPLSGCAEYLAPNLHIEGNRTVALICRNRTSTEKLDICCDKAKGLVSLEHAAACGATHAVVEIEWGVEFVLALSFSPNDGQDRKRISKELSALMLRALEEEIHSKDKSASLRLDSLMPLMSNFALEFHSDIDLKPNQKPRTLEEFAEFSRHTERAITAKQAKVRPTAYNLVPLHILELLVMGTMNVQQSIVTHDEAIANKILLILDNVANKECSIQKFVRKLQLNAHFFKPSLREAVGTRIQAIGPKMKGLKQIGSNIKSFRLEEIKVADIDATLHRVQPFLAEVENFFKEFGNANSKLDYIDKARALDAQIITDTQSLADMIQIGEHFVFCANLTAMNAGFRENSATFEKLCRENSGQCVLLDTDIDRREGMEGHSIHHYADGVLIEDNVCRLEKLLQSSNVIKYNVSSVRDSKKPNHCVAIEAICPNSLHGGCYGKKRKWICYSCRQTVEYGFNNYFYCDCGEWDPGVGLWYCQDRNHGTRYAKFEKDRLEEQLSKIKKHKEFNLLLIGEADCGKATWMNAIVNYIANNEFESALQSSVTCINPFSFPIQTGATEFRKIEIAQQNNKDTFKEEPSKVQKIKIYTFMFGDVLVRMINVPGFCHSRLIENKEKHFELILDAIRSVPEINAICVFLPSDAEKPTSTFHYCVTKLLTTLHESITKNVIFCVTKTRQTYYRAGQVLPTLMQFLDDLEKNHKVGIHLEDDIMFLFENEAFRLLCAMKEGVKFIDEDQKTYYKSWSISAEEAKRFLNHVLKLEPHQTCELLRTNISF